MIAASAAAIEVVVHLECGGPCTKYGIREVYEGLKCASLSTYCSYYSRDVFRPAQAIVPGYEGHHFLSYFSTLKVSACDEEH